ncbi:cupin domain-containing protein [Mucilaginibacter humi]|nr:hypothetical protein [Mucilaginibacter humi]
MNYGNPGERPKTDENLKRVPIPDTDPLQGDEAGLPDIWKE